MKEVRLSVAVLMAALCVLIQSAQAYGQTTAEGTVAAKSFIGPVTNREVRYCIWLPPDYGRGEQRYPVVYFLHGLGGNETSDGNTVSASLSKAIDVNLVRPMIAVFANGYKDSRWADSKDGNIPAQTNVIKELIPHIDATYRTIADREHRIITGFSMGGFGAVMYAAKFPDLFSICVGYDSALWGWERQAKNKEKSGDRIFGGDPEYYRQFDPWSIVKKDPNAIKDKVAIRLVVADFKDVNRRFRDFLAKSAIDVNYFETTCPHNPGCLLDQAGADSWSFIENHLPARPGPRRDASRRPNIVSPQVHPDRTVTFRLEAPKAGKVAVVTDFVDSPAPMTKDANGIWSITLGPVEPEIYDYDFNVDGLSTIDPLNTRLKVYRRGFKSLVEVPGATPMFFQQQPVPHGTIHVHKYESKSLGLTRGLCVYTPPDYDARAAAQYPVLYLLHGSGDNERTWTDVGQANIILDNLIAAGKARPMIVVMPYGHTQRDAAAERPVNNTAQFERDLLGDVIPLVEKHYRVEKEQTARAIAGLSMGGGQALTIGLQHPEMFAWVAGFSSGARDASEFVKSMDGPELLNQKLKLLWVGCGKKDFLFEQNQAFIDLLKSRNINLTTHITEGSHQWRLWRNYLNELAPLLFAAEKQPG